MSYKQGSHLLRHCIVASNARWLCWVFGLLLQITISSVGAATLKAVDAVTLAGNKLQIQLTMDAEIESPQVFQTDNPARIALDFPNVSNGLNKKVVNVNQGGVSNIFFMASEGRMRVIVNMLASVPYETAIKGNQVLLTLAPKVNTANVSQMRPVAATNPGLSRLLPQQGISNVDFRRGDKGEGRIIIALANPNTLINAKDVGGKVEVEFLNTNLPGTLSKSLDVSDFATPVKNVVMQMRGGSTVVTVTPVNGNYEYSSFQANGEFTLEFRPLSQEEKVALEKDKFPYVGEKLSLNFQDIEIRAVLQILADFTKLNVVAADDVQGRVTLQMNDVPWDQALDLILKSKGLSKRVNGSVILVAKTEDINKIESSELEAKKVIEQLEPLKTEYIQINYAKAENFRLLVSGMSTGGVDGCAISKAQTSLLGSGSAAGGSGGSMMGGPVGGGATGGGLIGNANNSMAQDVYRLLSHRGTAVVDGRTNTLIVKDTGEKISEIRKLIELLDKPVRQVMIESRIVLASNNLAKELGVRFGGSKIANVGGGKTFGIGGGSQTNNINPTTTSSSIDGSMNVKDALVDLGSTGAAIASGFPPAALGMTLARGADYVLNLELSALQNAGEAEILSNPRVMTSDRCKAVITQGQQIPYVTPATVQSPATVTFQDAILQLEVIPQITPSGSVIMNLNIKKDEAADLTGNPRINNREINTTVTVSDGETIVLGGVFENIRNKRKDSIPFLSELPGIGSLFAHKADSDQKQELLIFVTPKIAVEGLSSQ